MPFCGSSNQPVLADVGLPMLALQFPILVLLLLPIILIEIAIARLCMASPLPPRFASGVAWANVLSTLLGIPLAWFGLVLLEFGGEIVFYWVHGDFTSDSNFPERHKHLFDLILVFWSAPWLTPFFQGSDYYWIMPTANFILLVPYFFVSVRVEAWIMRKFWQPREKAEVLAASRRANAASYSLLAAGALVWLIATGWRYGWP
jgi:hypothetical protein